MANLPKGVEASALVDLSTLNLKGDSLARVSSKIDQAVFEELSSIDYGSGLVVTGRFRNLINGGMRIKNLSALQNVNLDEVIGNFKG